jgi:diaminopropionate ammonia-lyase
MGATRLTRNPDAVPAAPAATPQTAPRRFHASLPGYAPSPLIEAPTVAEALGVARVWIKDESSRLGMPSFKILGASWATFRALCAHLGVQPDEVDGLEDLRGRLVGSGIELVAATDGNHGRAVARMAALLDLTAHILVPEDMVPARIAAIEGEGARVTVVDGTYDEAVAASAAEADDRHLVISDTSWPGYEDVPSWVIDGYTTIGQEIDEELTLLGAGRPDFAVAQIGVGAFASAVVQHFRPLGSTIIGVEPTRADCAIASIEAGGIATVPGPHDSIMAGLNCGSPSLIAWPTMRAGIDAFVAIDDDRAREAMRLLAAAGIVSGESGAAGLGGLLEFGGQLGLTPESTVLLVSTEGATDPVGYREIVGREPEAVTA